jgi:hypothetical protein
VIREGVQALVTQASPAVPATRVMGWL